MQQILFDIPLQWLHAGWHIPIYGYGLMLFFAYLLCTTLGKYLCKREGIDGQIIPDLAIWLFVAGILGGRIVFVIQFWHTFEDGWHIIRLWDGGLVLYGSLAGGIIAYFVYDHFVLRKLNVSIWKMLDIIAPCIVLGIALGRVGCLCTGCCWGNVACDSCPALHFPIGSPAAKDMIQRGYQTPQGFLLDGRSLRVAVVEPGSAAANSGLRPDDTIVEVNGVPAMRPDDVVFTAGELSLTVLRAGQRMELSPFEPRSIGLHPTQVYETISMCLLLFFLLSYFPYRRYRGELMVFLMFGYGVHRFLNEMLRTDNDPVAFGLTLSQNVSILVLAAGVILAFIVYRRPPIAEEVPSSRPIPETSITHANS
jgi:phosphatidylglycerol---prolipoprotein diacylglyceryl transferase